LNRTKTLLFVLAALLAASCTPVADKPAPTVIPTGNDRFLVDPRVGYTDAIPPAIATRFDTAWRYVLAGDEAEARRRLADVLQRSPDFQPAILAGAALDLRAERYDAVRDTVTAVLQRNANYTAARVYEAELAYRQRQTREAYDLYRAVVAMPNAPPFAQERLTELHAAVFNELYAAAQTAPDTEAIRLLREALALNAGAVEARILLSQKLLAARQWDDARRELDPLLKTAPDRAEVQEMLAEIDVGRGRYQEAIVRYGRLATRTKDPRFERRLEEIKQEWSAANMPAHFRTALNSAALTRAEFATLLYWTVPSVRFAQNLPTPPIAIDVENVAAREEIIRAIAIGLFEVDAVTRRVSPHRQVTATRLSTHLARLLSLRGATCARGVAQERVLAACGVPDPLTGNAPDDPVSGREAAAALQQAAKHL
jgi:tetratricopeptide (TPR) repeat protein